MTKEIIKNRKGQKIVVLVEEAENQKGLAFIMHSLGGFKEQPQLETMADAFKKNDYTAIRFDVANTLGESGGRIEEATATNYYEDLDDAIKWASAQRWYEEPFVLTGHSLGGFCSILFAENYPEKVKALAPISTAITGKLFLEAIGKEVAHDWQKSGWKTDESQSKPGAIRKVSWAFVEDLLKYDLFLKINKLKMPKLLIVGDADETTPPKHQNILYDALLEPKEIHVIKDAPHTFREEKHLKEIKKIFNRWVKLLE